MAAKSASAPLTDAEVAAFERDGFVEVEGVIPQKASEDIADAMLHLARAQKCPKVSVPNFEGLPYAKKARLLLETLHALEKADHEYIRAIHDSVRESPALLRVIMSKPLTDRVVQLLGQPANSPLYPMQRSCRMDMPGDKAFALDWHQEVHYTFKDAQLIQLWAPAVTDVVMANGALRILPGSHKAGVAKTIDRVPEFGHAQYTVEPAHVAKFRDKAVTMKRGNALLFSKLLVHKSGENSSDLPRLTLITHYHSVLAPDFFSNIKPPKAVKNPYTK